MIIWSINNLCSDSMGWGRDIYLVLERGVLGGVSSGVIFTKFWKRRIRWCKEGGIVSGGVREGGIFS